MSKSFLLPLLAVLGTATVAEAQSISKRLEFQGRAKSSFKSAGVDFFFSDVPVDQAVNGRDLSVFPGNSVGERLISELQSPMSPENLYQLTQFYDRLDSQVSGQLIGYHNRSDDTDVNMQIVVGNKRGEKLKPNTTYLVSAKLEFYTNVSSASFGIGGAADSNAFGLAVSQYPWTAQKQLPKQPSQPTEPQAPVDNEIPYFGISPKFFIESSELKEIAESTFPTLNEQELQLVASQVTVAPSQGPDAYRAAMIKVIGDMANATLVELAKPASAQVYKDTLSKRLAAAIDESIQAKLADLSPEDIQNLKDMFGGSGDPVMFMAAAQPSILAVDDGVAMLRTYTKDNDGQVRPLGVPSGDCSADRPGHDANEKWLCSRYSAMGRINNGGLDAGVWAANSISTSTPVEIRTDDSGRPLYLNLTSHSGFEGLTVYYVKAIEYKVVEKK